MFVSATRGGFQTGCEKVSDISSSKTKTECLPIKRGHVRTVGHEHQVVWSVVTMNEREPIKARGNPLDQSRGHGRDSCFVFGCEERREMFDKDRNGSGQDLRVKVRTLWSR